jgi:hypothetical protein
LEDFSVDGMDVSRAVRDDWSQLVNDSLSGGLDGIFGDWEDEGGCGRGGLGEWGELGELDLELLCEDQVVQASPSLDAAFLFQKKGGGSLVGKDIVDSAAVDEFGCLIAVVGVGSRSGVSRVQLHLLCLCLVVFIHGGKGVGGSVRWLECGVPVPASQQSGLGGELGGEGGEVGVEVGSGVWLISRGVDPHYMEGVSGVFQDDVGKVAC